MTELKKNCSNCKFFYPCPVERKNKCRRLVIEFGDGKLAFEVLPYYSCKNWKVRRNDTIKNSEGN